MENTRSYRTDSISIPEGGERAALLDSLSQLTIDGNSSGEQARQCGSGQSVSGKKQNAGAGRGRSRMPTRHGKRRSNITYLFAEIGTHKKASHLEAW